MDYMQLWNDYMWYILIVVAGLGYLGYKSFNIYMSKKIQVPKPDDIMNNNSFYGPSASTSYIDQMSNLKGEMRMISERGNQVSNELIKLEQDYEKHKKELDYIHDTKSKHLSTEQEHLKKLFDMKKNHALMLEEMIKLSNEYK